MALTGTQVAYGIFFGIIYACWQGLGQWMVASMFVSLSFYTSSSFLAMS